MNYDETNVYTLDNEKHVETDGYSVIVWDMPKDDQDTLRKAKEQTDLAVADTQAREILPSVSLDVRRLVAIAEKLDTHYISIWLGSHVNKPMVVRAYEGPFHKEGKLDAVAVLMPCSTIKKGKK